MKCSDVYRMLESVQTKDPRYITENNVNFLEGHGLVSLLSQNAKNEIKKRMQENTDTVQITAEQIRELHGLKEEYKVIEKKHNSKTHKIWSVATHFNLEALDEEEDQIDSLETRINNLKSTIKQKQDHFEMLGNPQDELSGYNKIGSYLIKLTKKGMRNKNMLDARMDSIKDKDYDRFLESLGKKLIGIEKRENRFYTMQNIFKENGWNVKDPQVINCVLMLSGMDGNLKKISDHASKINNKFYNSNWQSYERLRPVYLIARQGGNPETALADVNDIFSLMTSDHHKSSYGTWCEAAVIRQFPGRNNQERYDRFETLNAELDKRQWKSGANSTCYIASFLGQEKGKEDYLVEEFRNLEKKIIISSVEADVSIKDCPSSGYAAIMLFNSEGTLTQKSQNFAEAWKAMHDAKWANSEQYYAAAAIIATTDDIKSNVQLLDEFITRKPDWMNDYTATYVGLPIVTEKYIDRIDARD